VDIVFFSKSDEVMEWWQNIMPIYSDEKEIKINYQNKNKTLELKKDTTLSKDSENVFLIRKRKSRIYSNKNFFNYPISLNFDTIKKIGFINTIFIVFSYIKAILFPIKEEKTLEDFFINRFGSRLYKTFFKDYTEKVWGVPCNEISAEWGKQSIKGLSITKTILFSLKKLVRLNETSIGQKNTETSLIEYFLYPKYGPGQMWDLVAKDVDTKGDVLKQNNEVTIINYENNTIKSVQIKNRITGETETITADYYISTMPIKNLMNSFTSGVPKKVKNVSDGLLYRDFITVGLLLKDINHELEDNWIYIQENYVKVGRLQIFNNWSPFMVKDNKNTWVGLEYFCTVNDDLWKKEKNEMVELAILEMIELGFINSKESVLDSKVIKVPKAYPAYFGSYSNFNIIKEFTNTIENLFLIGRNGMHKYNNQDHSMLTAIKQ
jgi:protoporphyrinogen oxidase